MKNQYFGDITDYRKYGLLQLIASHTNLRIGICWMLTENDGRTDGGRTIYLSQPAIWRHYDPALYDYLRYYVTDCGERDITKIENERILPGFRFFSTLLQDNAEARQQYFSDLKDATQGCGLLFFDADNGMEVKSYPYGRKSSSKYLYWREVKGIFDHGQSLLIFQCHRHMKYAAMLQSLSSECEKIPV